LALRAISTRSLGHVRWPRVSVRRRISGASLAAVLASILVLTTSVALEQRADAAEARYYYSRGQSVIQALSTTGTPILKWDPQEIVPPQWTAFPGVMTVVDASGLTVRTTSDRFSYQLWSNPISLERGHYTMALTGRVEQGGLYLGVLDARASTWITTTYYWSGQEFGEGRMTAPFALSVPTQIRLVLSNWAPENRASLWHLDSVVLESAN